MEVQIKTADIINVFTGKYTLINGKQEDLWQCFWPDGHLAEQAMYKDTLFNGVYRSWYSNGQLHRQCMYVAGKKEGLSIGWHPNGTIRERGMYVGDVPDGIHTYWNMDGDIMEELNYCDRDENGDEVDI